jgi:predicted nucleic acid-binding protein
LSARGILELIPRLPFDIRTTEFVLAELAAGIDIGRPVFDPGVSLIGLKSLIHPSLAVELQSGEASVIQAGMENPGAMVWIDERLGRFKTEALELPLIGTLGMLARAKTEGLLESLREPLSKMIQGGVWLRPQLVEKFLKTQGE